jgi:hypothetical protein
MPLHVPPKTTNLRVVVFIQENKTPDFYFPSLAAWGADVLDTGPRLSALNWPPKNGRHEVC